MIDVGNCVVGILLLLLSDVILFVVLISDDLMKVFVLLIDIMLVELLDLLLLIVIYKIFVILFMIVWLGSKKFVLNFNGVVLIISVLFVWCCVNCVMVVMCNIFF